MFFEHLLREVINVIEYSSQHSNGVRFIAFIVLHVRVPHEICNLIGNDHLLGFLTAEIEELDVVFVGGIVVEQFQRKVNCEVVLPHTGLNQPLVGDLRGAVVDGVELMGGIDGEERQV